MEEFLANLLACADDPSLLDFCRKHTLHGTPQLFRSSEQAFYDFRKRIASKFDVHFLEVFITGSAHLGFSPHKQRPFDYNSDVDVAIVSSALYEKIMAYIQAYQMALRENRKAVSQPELDRYHRFLEYGAMGWMRPDLLPTSFRVQQLKTDWFDFFASLSYGKSEAGNYKVTAGVFKTYSHFESYTLSGLRALRTKLLMRSAHVPTDKA